MGIVKSFPHCMHGCGPCAHQLWNFAGVVSFQKDHLRFSTYPLLCGHRGITLHDKLYSEHVTRPKEKSVVICLSQDNPLFNTLIPDAAQKPG